VEANVEYRGYLPLAVQIKKSNTLFSIPLYLPPGQKKGGVSEAHLFLRCSGFGVRIVGVVPDAV